MSEAFQKESELTFKYYRHIELYGKEPVMGLIPVDPDEAMEINCYVFTYEDSLLQSVEYYKEGKLTDDPQMEVARILIEYREKTYIRQFQNNEGGQIARDNGQYFEVRYSYPVEVSIYTKNIGRV